MSMKKKIQYVAAIALLALLTFSTSVMAQPGPGDDGGAGGGPPVGGGAPIGSGVYVLIGLALAYGFSRWYALRKQTA
jgi:hypothetical protein